MRRSRPSAIRPLTERTSSSTSSPACASATSSSATGPTRRSPLRTPALEVVQKAAASAWQDVFPVLDEQGKVVGIVLSDVLRTMAANPDIGHFTIAHDLMVPPVSVQDTDNLQRALEIILEHGLREIAVVGDNGQIVGFLDEAEITRVYHDATVSRRPE